MSANISSNRSVVGCLAHESVIYLSDAKIFAEKINKHRTDLDQLHERIKEVIRKIDLANECCKKIMQLDGHSLEEINSSDNESLERKNA